MGSAKSDLPYWQFNVAPAERTDACPDFLANLTDKDRAIIGTPAAQYRIHTWAEVRQRVADNRLDLFARAPSELRRYLEYTWGLRQRYGSVINFVLQERLGWATPVMPEGRAPFACDGDIKILRNDWPYGIDKRIIHLVVWTKFPLAEDSDSGDLTEAARDQIDDYVTKVFRTRVPSDHACPWLLWLLRAVKDVADTICQVVWFKNWGSLKSVKVVEHFHVMLFDPDPAFVAEVTNGDIPLSEATNPARGAT